MRSDKTTNRQRAQRARRDAEREAYLGTPERPVNIDDLEELRAFIAALDLVHYGAPEYPPRGEYVGRILFELWGQSVEVKLLSTGNHARSFLIETAAGVRKEIMGPTEAWRLHVSPGIARMRSRKNYR